MIYDAFADVYDQLMDDYDYDQWSEYYKRLINKAHISDKAPRIVECACGTGNITIRLAQMGFNMMGVDASVSMLRSAERKARQAGVDITFVHQDMRKLTVGRAADAVLCTCDGINYLTEIEDLKVFFSAAYRALRHEGLLAFDFSSRYKLESIVGDSFFGEERDGIALLWKNELNKEKHLVRMDVTCFVRDDDGRYRRFREEHRQRAHDQEELIPILKECGFEEICCYGEMRMDGPKAEDQRIHMTARKR